MTLVPALLLGLATSALATGVPVEVPMTFAEEPPSISHGESNPCSVDRDGNPVPNPKNCAGLVRALPKPSQAMGWNIQEKNGQVAAYLDFVHVPFVLDQKLAISSDYPRDSCPYKATLDHEMKHWKANIALFKKKAQAIKSALEKISLLPSKDKPLVSSKYNSERFRSQLDKLVHDRINDMRKQLGDEMRESVAELDDPMRYKRDDWSKCPPSDWKGKQ